jgi:hypothetical protein
VKQRNAFPAWSLSSLGTFLLMATVCSWSQNPAPPDTQSAAMAAAIHDLQEQVQQLRAAVAEVRSEAAQYRAETAELRRELETTRAPEVASSVQPPTAAANLPGNQAGVQAEAQPASSKTSKTLEERVALLEDSHRLLGGKLDEQYQTKVESGSKYHVRLSGMVLTNFFSDRGAVDNVDIPTFALPQSPASGNGNFGATLRQSQIGLEVFGPRVAGARTSGSLQADFAGGFQNTWNGVANGFFRLRTASIRMDWEKTSIIAGQDPLFLSPNSPTSYASLAQPALSYAGNLWGWIPQVRVEHSFSLSDGQNVTVQGGILDNFTGDYPATPSLRVPHAGERTGQPAFGTRVAWRASIFGQPLTLGTAAYYSHQEWQFSRHIDGWAGMADWSIPLPGRLNFSGEFYRGRALGGLGGGIGRSVLYVGNPAIASTQVYGLDAVGGWSQLKLKATPKLEFNAAFGLDSPYADEGRDGITSQPYIGPIMVQNRGSFANFIFKPRSDLLFSTEYRYLRTTDAANNTYTAGQLNLIVGILF